MGADYNPLTPSEKYITKVEKYMGITTNGGTPYSLEQILTIAYDAIYRTGIYNKKCIAWEDLDPANKIWPNWKIFFMKVIRD
eukprot:1327340-Ditylum_brightwellii.AAC.1